MQEVAAQLEALLVTAHKLQLQPLLQRLHNFLFSSLSVMHEDGGHGLFKGCSHLVFPDRLFEAALGSGTVSREQYLTSVLPRPCGVINDGVLHTALLVPKPGSVRMCNINKTIQFEAHLTEPMLGSISGDAVGVVVDLLSGTLFFGDTMSVPVRLMVGCVVDDVAQLPHMFPKPDV